MITLSNGHSFEYMVASGALGFDGRGWAWERPMVAMGLIKPELFTVVIKSLTRQPRIGNLNWWKPWECVRLLEDGGAVNKVGLTNPGIDWWVKEIGPTLDFKKVPLVGSIFGEKRDLIEMTWMLNKFDFVALEVNVSCPNTGHPLEAAGMVVETVTEVADISRHPVIGKVSVDQDYLAIARGLKGMAQAVSLNSVPWSLVFPDKRTPLWKLEQKVGGGGGGVSGRPAQVHNWAAVDKLAAQGDLPVIGPSVMEFGDLKWLRECGAQAISFGVIHLPDHPIWLKPWTILTNPCKPTNIVIKDTFWRTGTRLI